MSFYVPKENPSQCPDHDTQSLCSRLLLPLHTVTHSFFPLHLSPGLPPPALSSHAEGQGGPFSKLLPNTFSAAASLAALRADRLFTFDILCACTRLLSVHILLNGPETTPVRQV